MNATFFLVSLTSSLKVAVPCVISAVFGMAMVGYNNTTNVLLIDMYPGQAGTATASNNLSRCLVGAGGTAAIVPMINAMGLGWAFTLIGGLYFLCIPVLVLLMLRGKKWRHDLRVRQQQDS